MPVIRAWKYAFVCVTKATTYLHHDGENTKPVWHLSQKIRDLYTPASIVKELVGGGLYKIGTESRNGNGSGSGTL